ncbi:MAG: T9SS type A sorting domain-containing protein, partial [Bacteroidota bacterium]
IQSMSGDFVIGYDFREAYPTYPTPFYGIGATRIDPVGNILFNAQHILGVVGTSNPFRLHHVAEDMTHGLFLLAGEYNLGGGVVEPFMLQIDGGGGLVNDLFHYSFPGPIGGIVEVNGMYYVSFTTATGEIAMGEIDPSGVLTNVFEFAIPPPLLNGAVSTVISHDLQYNPNSNYFELLLNYTDGVNNSYGMGFVDYSSPFVMEYFEYEYDPGTLEGTPVSFVDLQPGLPFPLDDRLALVHPEGGILPNPNPQEQVRLELFQLTCITLNGDAQPMNPSFYSTSQVPLNLLLEGWSCDTDVNPFPYSGNIYDCSGGFLSPYRQANPNVAQATPELELQVYPNPVQDVLILDVEFQETLQAKVLDPLGKTVLQAENQTKLDVRSLAPGVYILEVIADQQRFVESILVER